MKPCTRTLWLPAAVVIAWASPRSALAASVQLCADTNISYTDNGYGEDYWTTDGNRQMAGVRIRARRYYAPGSVCDFSGSSGYLDYYNGYADSGGCTGSFLTGILNSCWQLTVWSYGYPGGSNYLSAKNANGSTEYWKINGVTPSAGKSWWSFPGLDSFKVYATMAAGISWFRGSLSGKSLYAQASDDDCVCGGGGDNVGNRYCSSGSTGYVCLSEDYGVDRKFLMAHEYGHHTVRQTAGSWSSGLDCGSHAMTSQEEQACALMEGWANFVSAAVWNSFHTNAGGKLRYWGACRGSSTVNVEGSGNGSNCKVKYMEKNYSSSSWPGNATELDWMRTLWDYFTNSLSGEPGSRPSHNQMQAELVGYLPTTSGDAPEAYDLYRKGVAADSSCSQYERLVHMAAANGADHCEHEGSSDWCDNVPVCADVD